MSKYYKLIIVGMIVMQTFVMIYFCSQKSGFFMDEISTYGLSNYDYCPFIQYDAEYRNNWHNKEYFEKYLVVAKENRFSFDSVFYNQSKDVHPPAYYCLIHMICSMFPGKFSKWYGLFLNLVVFIMCDILLYMLAKKMSNDALLPVFVILTWGSSVAAVSAVVLIRMYLLVSFFLLLWSYFMETYFKQYKSGSVQRKTYGFIFLTGVIGILTQYFVLIYLFFFSVAVCLYLLYKKDLIEIIRYAATVIGSVCSSFIIFPAGLYHIFSGYRGEEAFQQIYRWNEFSKNLKLYTNYISEDLFTGKAQIIWYGILVIFITGIFMKYIRIKDREDCAYYSGKFDFDKSIFKICCVVALIGYFGVVAQITPDKVNRYMWPIYPLLMLIFYVFLYDILKFLYRKESLFLGIGIVLTINTMLYLNKEKVQYLYLDASFAMQSIKENESNNCIYIYENGDWETYAQYTELMQFQNVYITEIEHISNIVQALDEIANQDQDIIVFLPSNDQKNEDTKRLQRYLSAYKQEKLFDYGGKTAVKFYLKSEDEWN